MECVSRRSDGGCRVGPSSPTRRLCDRVQLRIRRAPPWGSHPLLDPLWSTEDIEFTHDGCEALRSAKIKAIARAPLALSTLRVCWANEQAEYNCGRCEKCLRTMIALHVVGALDRCTTFNQPLSVTAVRRMQLGESSELFLRAEIVAALGPSPKDRKLARAIEHVLRRRRWRTRAGRLARRYLGDGATYTALWQPSHRQPLRGRKPERNDSQQDRRGGTPGRSGAPGLGKERAAGLGRPPSPADTGRTLNAALVHGARRVTSPPCDTSGRLVDHWRWRKPGGQHSEAARSRPPALTDGLRTDGYRFAGDQPRRVLHGAGLQRGSRAEAR